MKYTSVGLSPSPYFSNLFARIEDLTKSAEGIQSFRKLIVCLAVNGQLKGRRGIKDSLATVSQLLEVKKDFYAKFGTTNQQYRESTLVTPEECPVNTNPPTYWVRISDVCRVEKGNVPILKAKEGPYPLVTTGEQRSRHCEFQFNAEAAIIPLVSSTGHGHASLKRLHFQNGEFALGNILCAVIPFDQDLLSSRFVYEYLNAFKDELLVARMSGTANVSLTVNKILEVPVPVVCRSVQTTVCELMELCDELESRQAKRTEARKRLVSSALDRLVSSQSAVEMTPHANRVRDHFDQLFDTPTTIPQLRQTILQLAVQGKLVKQNDQDVGVDALVKEIEKSRDAYNRAQSREKAKVRGQEINSAYKSTFSPILSFKDDCAKQNLPAGWFLIRVMEAGEVQLGRQRAPHYHNGPNMRPYLRVQNVHEDRIDISDVKEMDFSPEEFVVFQLRYGDVLLNEGQSFKLVGRPAIYRNEVPGACFQNTLIRFRPYAPIPSEFALLVFRAYMHSGKFQSVSQQTTNIAHLSAGRFSALEFPLPPIAEQKRIVAKVNQLMAMCDRLEFQLQVSESSSSKLLRASISQVLSATM